MRLSIVVLAALGLPSQAHAWGGRGHAAICETAVFLLKEPGLKGYLENKPQMMGHLCNLPDTYWRSLGPEATNLGNPTHFIDVDITGLKVTEVPTDFKAIVHAYTGAPNRFKREGVIRDVPAELGSVWWRADQFYRRFLSFNRQFQAAGMPKNAKEARDDRLPYNRAVYEMVVSLGLMGHFVGDASQPLHNTADYDGYATGHGGLHAYYEDEVVGQFDGDLQSRVLEEARTMKQPECLKPPQSAKARRLAIRDTRGSSSPSFRAPRSCWRSCGTTLTSKLAVHDWLPARVIDIRSRSSSSLRIISRQRTKPRSGSHWSTAPRRHISRPAACASATAWGCTGSASPGPFAPSTCPFTRSRLY